MAANIFKVRNGFLINDEDSFINVFVTGITNDSGLTADSEYNLVTEWAIKRNVADALQVLNELSLSGLTDVDLSGLTEGQYLMFTGGTWINVNAEFLTPTYTNYEPTPEEVGGIEAGSTFSAVTLQDMWTDLLYPYQNPTVSSLKRTISPTFNPGSITQSDNVVEVGYTLYSGGTTYWWNYDVKGKPENAPDNLVIRDMTSSIDLITGLAIDDTPKGYTGSTTIQHLTPTTHTWRIRGQDTSLQYYSDTTYLNWWHYFYYGEYSGQTLIGTDLELLGTQSLTNTVSLTHTFEAGVTYKYYCFPTGYTMTGIKDQATNLDVDMAGPSEGYNYGPDNGKWSYDIVTRTNQFGLNIAYKVFRTRFTLNGEVTIIYT